MFTSQRIRDPLHNLIEFRADEFENVLWSVIQTRPFQRLRRVKQLGFSDLVYPGATHSRFAHSVGVFHTARQLMKVIKAHLGTRRFLETRAHVALAAALVHDVGHGPFSHAFEEVGRRLNLKMAHHEQVSDALIREGEVSDKLKALGSGYPTDVADMVKSAGPGNIYSAVVSSQFDADRLDYMRRDRLMTGTQHGAIDFEWLIANIEVGNVPYGVDEKSLGTKETFVLGPKATYAAETYVLGLFQLYPTVYFHKATRSAEKLFTELLFKVISLIRYGSIAQTGLSKNHPLVRFASESDSVERVLSLDDTVVWGALPMMEDANDPVVSEFAKRLWHRKLFKCLDIRDGLINQFKPNAIDISVVDKACAAIGEKISNWTSEKVGNQGRILLDQAVREPYKRFEESKGPLNQIMIRTAKGGALIDLAEQSEVVAAIKPFRLFRAYVSESDDEAKEFVAKAIAMEVTNVTSK